MWAGTLTFVCLLASAGFHQPASAARTWEQRRVQGDPYAILPPGLVTGGRARPAPKALGEKQFTLRHIYHHGTHEYPTLHKYMDIPPQAELRVTQDDGHTYELAPPELPAKVASLSVQRLVHRQPADVRDLLHHAEFYGDAVSLPSSAWTIDEVAGPNVTDKETVLTFAKMSHNAYESEVDEGKWMDVGSGLNESEPFGWEYDGLRGHIFVDKTNSTIVVAIKGTTVAILDGAETTTKDKTNDNLFGSCCCGQGGQYFWRQVCSCMTSTYTCNSTCVVKQLHKRENYYRSGLELYGNITERYPGADVWLTGHSLGGVVSALLGLTFGSPTVTYEAYPDALAASRLGLPVPPGYQAGSHNSRTDTGIFHIGHTADPIFMGACNTASSLCTIAGYAFEGQCHTGQTCIYDTVKDLGWNVAATSHRILNVITQVLPKYDTGPTCDVDVECQDCFNWKFFESNGTETTTTSSGQSSTSTSTRTRTRTETCKTPGWWGCLDETSTTASTSTSSTSSSSSSSSTSTCQTPGWFGCNDKTTATTTTTSSSTVATTPSTAPVPTTTTTSSTSTCKTPGWFGCNDPTTTASATPKPSPSSAIATASQTSFSTSSIAPSAQPTATHEPVHWQRHCRMRRWYGACTEWETVPSNYQVDL